MEPFPPVFWEIHQGLPQEGPGSDASTGRAFDMLDGLTASPETLDIGCGPGRQTLELARRGCRITAVDNHAPFLETVDRRAAGVKLSDRIRTVRASMDRLPFVQGSFDLVWCEGAAYIMGFRKALSAWRKLIKPGGFLALSEACWLKRNPPEKIREFWKNGYPAMKSVKENSRILRDHGFEELGRFTLPESDWEAYYRPVERRVMGLREKHARNPDALSALWMEQDEIDLYREFGSWYGYVFFAARRKDA